MLLGYNIQKYTNVVCSVALTNAGSMCDRTPKRAATFAGRVELREDRLHIGCVLGQRIVVLLLRRSRLGK